MTDTLDSYLKILYNYYVDTFTLDTKYLYPPETLTGQAIEDTGYLE